MGLVRVHPFLRSLQSVGKDYNRPARDASDKGYCAPYDKGRKSSFQVLHPTVECLPCLSQLILFETEMIVCLSEDLVKKSQACKVSKEAQMPKR